MCSASPSATRNGFTLSELVVALTLLAWGALAVVAATARAIRTVTESEEQTRAVAVARGRVERLAAAGCTGARDGTAVDSARAIRERWTTTVHRNGARVVTDSVRYGEPGAKRRVVVVQRLVVC